MKTATGRLLGKLALTLACALALLPTLARDARAELSGGGTEGEPYVAGSWADLRDALNAGGWVQLSGDVTAGDGDSGLSVPADRTVVLDLNGHVIDRALAAAAGNGSVITVGGALILTDSRPDAQHSPAVTCIDPITQDSVPVSGGVITGGNSAGFAGGVYVHPGVQAGNASFTMNGGTIVGNAGNGCGGVYVDGTANASTAAFTMNGGSIAGNTASGGAGGVSVNGGNASFTMNRGSVAGNMAAYGGGVSVNGGAFTMESGGAVTGNTAAQKGGGVYLFSGAFTMNGGSITGNTASGSGGGAYLDGTFTMNGGSITGNTASVSGGGIYLEDYCEAMLSGAPKVTANTVGGAANNVFVSYDPIKVVGALDEAASVGVTVSGGTGSFATGATDPAHDLSDDDVARFTSDGGNYRPIRKNFGTSSASPYRAELAAVVEVGSWSELHDALQAGGHITLTNDCTFGVGGGNSSSEPLVVPERQAVVLDLAGHTIDRGLTSAVENGSVIAVKERAYLTLRDSSEDQTGVVTGGNTTHYGGGVMVGGNVGATFTLEGGAIKGNEVSQPWSGYSGGGGVYAKGSTFVMRGGSIIGNKVSASESTGESYNGGGVYVDGSSTFTMDGGTVSGNTAERGAGAGVYVSGGAFRVGGAAAVKGNWINGTEDETGAYVQGEDGTADNVFLCEGCAITVTGALTGGAGAFGVTLEGGYTGAFTSGLSGKGTAASFVSDKASYAVGLNASGDAELAAPVTVTFDANGGTGTMAAQALPSGLAAALNANAFTRAGYAFAGWNTRQDGTGTAYEDKASVTLMEDTTLWAQWTHSVADGTVYGPAGAVLLVASYDRGGKMTDLHAAAAPAQGWNGASVRTLAESAGFTLPDSFKLMLVNGETFAPLCEAWAYTSEQ